MKTFFSVLFAILVAAGIIWFIASLYQARQQVETRREHVRELTLDGEMRQAQVEWDEQMRRNPQFDPNAEKLRARLREIKEVRGNSDRPNQALQPTAQTA
jgi:hypothetical protein